MQILIDLKLLAKNELTINEYLTLVKINYINRNEDIPFTSTDKIIDSLIHKGFLKRNNGLTITNKGLALFDQKDSLDELAEALRELYPKGKKGAYYWRGNIPEIKSKLKTFLTKFKDASYQQIIDATKSYVDSFNDFNRDNSMMLLKYFIYKDNGSTLYTYIENLDNNDVTDIKNSFERDI